MVKLNCLCEYLPPNESLNYEDVWRNRTIAPPFLASAIDEAEWSDTRPSPFFLGVRTFCIYWV
jgi:hypothetical protein